MKRQAPFKTCVRIPRTQLTDGLSGRRITRARPHRSANVRTFGESYGVLGYTTWTGADVVRPLCRERLTGAVDCPPARSEGATRAFECPPPRSERATRAFECRPELPVRRSHSRPRASGASAPARPRDPQRREHEPRPSAGPCARCATRTARHHRWRTGIASARGIAHPGLRTRGIVSAVGPRIAPRVCHGDRPGVARDRRIRHLHARIVHRARIDLDRQGPSDMLVAPRHRAVERRHRREPRWPTEEHSHGGVATRADVRHAVAVDVADAAEKSPKLVPPRGWRSAAASTRDRSRFRSGRRTRAR